MKLQANLYDPFAGARSLLVGDRKFAFFYGSTRDPRFLQSPGRDPFVDGTDIMCLNTLQVPFKPLHISESYLRQKVRHKLDDFDCIFNLVTNADSNEEILRSIAKVLGTYKGRIVNHPSQVLRTRRDIISTQLAGIPNLVVPKTIRIAGMNARAAERYIEKSGVTFPAIFRRAQTHKGRIISLARDPGEVLSKLEAGEKYYLTSFHDFRSTDGLYRKLRFFFIGDRIVMRHQLVSDHWNVHAADRHRFMLPRPVLVEEERELQQAYLEKLPDHLETMFVEIRRRIGLDFFGLDCALMEDDRVLLFESNATMNFSNNAFEDERFAYARKCIAPAIEGFKSLLRVN